MGRKTGYIIRKCGRCDEIVYRFKKNERPSDLFIGAEIGIHLLTCDRDKFDEILRRHF